MSERCATQKKFNNLLVEYWTSIIPKIISNCDNLSKEEQDKMTNVNDFFHGLHFLVGLADQAEASLKI